MRVWRYDSLKGFASYDRSFITLWESEIFSLIDSVNPKSYKYEIDSFSDSVSKVIFQRCKSSGKFQKSFENKNFEGELYRILESIRYLSPGECVSEYG